MEEKLAQRYYEEVAIEKQLRVGKPMNSEGDAIVDAGHGRRVNPREEQSSCILSPLNFSKLAIGGEMSID